MKLENENEKSSLTDKIEGDSKIAIGKIKKVAGDLARNPALAAKGNAEKNEGHVQKKIGEIKKVFGE
jgi:uncharacterized protein YjbJ (UPF0337 family)